MDNLERFKMENLNEKTVQEINRLSYEELVEISHIPGMLYIRDIAIKNRGFTGQTTYKNLAVIHKTGLKSKYEVVGAAVPNRHEEPIQVNPEKDFIAPEADIIIDKNASLDFFDEDNDSKPVDSETPKKGRLKIKNINDTTDTK